MNHTSFALLLLLFGALCGCGTKWVVTDQKFFKFQNHDVRLAAKVALTEKAKPNVGKKNGVELGLRLYSANFATLLTEVNQKVGAGLESSGTLNVPEVATIIVTDFRLGGTPNSYPDFCAEVKMENSNLKDWTRVGCVNFADTPSESPTGGLSLVNL